MNKGIRGYIVGWVSLLAGGGCSSAATPPVAVPLCDESMRLTLRIFYAARSDLDVPGGAVRIENGFPSFAVDGQCQYFMSGGWVSDNQSRDKGWRQGVVSDDLRSRLEARAGAEDLQAVYDCNAPARWDASPAIVANARSTVVCPGGGPAMRETLTVIRQRAQELWDEGKPLDGDLRITVREQLPSRYEPYTWPSALALSDYLQRDSDIFDVEPEGQSDLVAAASAAPLRALREQYLRDTESDPLYFPSGIPVTDRETSATVFMRDALPYEDERGLWPLPEEFQ